MPLNNRLPSLHKHWFLISINFTLTEYLCVFFKYGLHLLQSILGAILKRLLLGSKFYQYTNTVYPCTKVYPCTILVANPAMYEDQRFALREELWSLWCNRYFDSHRNLGMINSKYTNKNRMIDILCIRAT